MHKTGPPWCTNVPPVLFEKSRGIVAKSMMIMYFHKSFMRRYPPKRSSL
jgi:hypothetical protein